MELAGFLVLLASVIAAVGVILRAIRALGRTVRDVDARVRKLHDMSDPNGWKNEEH